MVCYAILLLYKRAFCPLCLISTRSRQPVMRHVGTGSADSSSVTCPLSALKSTAYDYQRSIMRCYVRSFCALTWCPTDDKGFPSLHFARRRRKYGGEGGERGVARNDYMIV